MTSTSDVPASSIHTSASDSSAATPVSPSTPPPSRKPTFQEVMIVAILLILVINTGLFAYIYMKSKTPAATPTPAPAPIAVKVTMTPKPTPTPYPLPQGKRSWDLSYGKEAKGPKILKVTVDPFDPKIGAKQTYTVAIQHTLPITIAELALNTDNKVATYSMQRISGTDTDGVWNVTVTTDDTHFYTYYPYFTVKSAQDKFQGGLTFRAY